MEGCLDTPNRDVGLKICCDCGETRTRSGFYLYRSGNPWRRCKACANKRSSAWAKAHPERALEFSRNNMRKAYAADPQKFRERLKATRRNNPERVAEWIKRARKPGAIRAKSAVQRAVATGRLVRPGECGACGIECKPEAHHPDYQEPLGVLWLCKPCHAQTWRIDGDARIAGG